MKKRKIFLSIACIFVIVFLSNCDGWGWREFITIHNNSDIELYVYLDDGYPDTFLTHHLASTLCQPHQSASLEIDADRNAFFSDRNSIAQVFIMNADSVSAFFKSDDDSLGFKFPYAHLELKRYELTRDWLEQHDWTVTYP